MFECSTILGGPWVIRRDDRYKMFLISRRIVNIILNVNRWFNVTTGNVGPLLIMIVYLSRLLYKEIL